MRAWHAAALLATLAAGCSREAPVESRGVDQAAPAAAPAVPEPASVPARAAVDAAALSGRDANALRVELGTPLDCNAQRCRYPNGVEVGFVDGVAEAWTLNDLRGAPFAAAALARAGLPADEPPIDQDAKTMRWQNLGGFREVVLHAGADGRAERIELRATTSAR